MGSVAAGHYNAKRKICKGREETATEQELAALLIADTSARVESPAQAVRSRVT
jgi:hypothetical protein